MTSTNSISLKRLFGLFIALLLFVVMGAMFFPHSGLGGLSANSSWAEAGFRIVTQEQPANRPATAPSTISCPTATIDVPFPSGKNRSVDALGDIECGDIDPANCERLQYGTIQGTVFDELGKPAPGVDVRIESRPAGGSFKLTTNTNGRYAHDGLLPGEYTACVSFRGELGLSRLLRLRVNRVIVSDFDLGFFDQPKRQLTPAR
jgi:hypothetical protein